MNGIVILGCGACFRTHFLSDSPSSDFDSLAHMWLLPINTAARGQTRGRRLLTTASTLGFLISVRPVKEKQIQSIRPEGAADCSNTTLSMSVLLMVFSPIPVRGCSHANLCGRNVSEASSWEKQGWP